MCSFHLKNNKLHGWFQLELFLRLSSKNPLQNQYCEILHPIWRDAIQWRLNKLFLENVYLMSHVDPQRTEPEFLTSS